MNIPTVSPVHAHTLAFAPLNIAVLSISDDSAGPCDRVAGLVDRLLGYGHNLTSTASMPEDDNAIRRQVQAWIDEGTVHVVLLVDNTTLSAGDVPPSVILTSENGVDEIYSTLVQDPVHGFVAIVNILQAQQWAA